MSCGKREIEGYEEGVDIDGMLVIQGCCEVQVWATAKGRVSVHGLDAPLVCAYIVDIYYQQRTKDKRIQMHRGAPPPLIGCSTRGRRPCTLAGTEITLSMEVQVSQSCGNQISKRELVPLCLCHVVA